MAMLLWERDYAASGGGVPARAGAESQLHAGPMLYGLFQLQWAEERLPEGLAEARRARIRSASARHDHPRHDFVLLRKTAEAPRPRGAPST
jgi:hypothetical protein